MLDLSRLSAEQRQAVLAGDGPLLIVAGPGSGKTTVLAARIAHLVTLRRVAPATVLAIAFATKAARELRTRLSILLGEQGHAVDVTTFHAFGFRIVRQWSEELGFGPGPLAVYGDADARTLLREAAGRLGLDLDGQPLAALAADLERHRLGRSDALPAGDMGPLARAYDDLLRRRGAVDYAAMLALPLQLFEMRPHALRLYQDAYRHILSDEYQDVCAAQYALLRRLAERHRNLVVVGDPCQTLFGWRGAGAGFLRGFQRDFPEAHLLSLSQNFRSTGRIVDLANALGATLVHGRKLWTDNPPGQRALLYAAPDERGEAVFVAAEIERLCVQQDVSHLGEVAILYRTNRQAHEIALALRAQGLRYRVRGSGDLFGRREARDAVAYLRLAHNPADAPALARIVNVPPRRLGRLAELLRGHSIALSELAAAASRFGPAAAANAKALAGLIDDLHAKSAGLDVLTLLDLALERSGYRAWLTNQPDGPARLGALATLREAAARAEGDLGAWLAELQLGEDMAEAPDDAQRVVLTTIHGAKGGEWRVVFVIGVEEGLLPHSRSLATAHNDSAGVEEELRVAYVAVTRPRERLYLTYCSARRHGEQLVPRQASRFLRTLPVERAA